MTTANVPVQNKTESKTVAQTPADTKRRRVVVPEYRVVPREQSVDLVTILPGVAEADLNIRLENHWLKVEGTSTEPEVEGFSKVYSEFSTVDYEAGFKLPNDIDSDNITARFRDGILTVSVPKAKESLPRSIAVNAN